MCHIISAGKHSSDGGGCDGEFGVPAIPAGGRGRRQRLQRRRRHAVASRGEIRVRVFCPSLECIRFLRVEESGRACQRNST